MHNQILWPRNSGHSYNEQALPCMTRDSMSEAPGTDRKRYLEELHIFHDVAKALTSSLNLDSVLQTIMDKMAAYFRPDTWSLLMTDEGSDELYFAIAVGEAAESLKSVRLKLGEGIAGWVARNGEPLIVPDVYTDPRFAKRIDEITKWKTRSMLCVPLKSKQRVLGVIQLINVPMEAFGDEQMFFLQALCDYAAIAIDNARSVARIEELSITDDCTGLYNARHLYSSLEAEVARSGRFGYEFTVLFIDLDHFKLVNDTHGHLVGDEVLRAAGALLHHVCRSGDVVARTGGEEFAVLLPDTDAAGAFQFASRLCDLVRGHPFPPPAAGADPIRLTTSVGIAAGAPEARGDFAAMFSARADVALYVAKRSGRDRVRAWSAHLGGIEEQ